MNNGNNRRPVFFLSDRTGITAETLGHTLLTQFSSVPFNQVTLPFVNDEQQAKEAVNAINEAAERSGQKPLVFSTIIGNSNKHIIDACNAVIIDLFETYTPVLEQALGIKATHVPGLSHGISNESGYMMRIEAVNFALQNDDGITTKNYDIADIILVGPSRSGKTPTCLYLGMQHGLCAANYPLADSDIERYTLSEALIPYREKLYGLIISAERLHKIRELRRPGSEYASMPQCHREIRAIRALYEHENLAYLDTTHASIEEISVSVIKQKHLRQKVYQ